MFLCPFDFCDTIIKINFGEGTVKMAREARKISSTGMYAISLCGSRLFENEEDEKVFHEMLDKYFDGGEVYGCALSKTEIRLVVKETPKGISMTMKPLITSYARYFNRTHNLEGKLFSCRFKSEPIESSEDRDEAVKKMSDTITGTQKPGTPRKTRDTKSERVKKPVKPAEEKAVKKPVRRNDMPSYLL